MLFRGRAVKVGARFLTTGLKVGPVVLFLLWFDITCYLILNSEVSLRIIEELEKKVGLLEQMVKDKERIIRFMEKNNE
jgi:hypothetical protein